MTRLVIFLTRLLVSTLARRDFGQCFQILEKTLLIIALTGERLLLLLLLEVDLQIIEHVDVRLVGVTLGLEQMLHA